MAQDTNVENLIINKLTRAQFESITTPDPTQLYFITDDNGLSSLDDISLSNVTNGQILKYNSTTQKWENSAASGGTWGSITGTLSNQTDLQDALNAKQDQLTAGDNITIEQEEGEWTPAAYISSLENPAWRALAYGNNKFVALSYGNSSGYNIATSTDGSTWSTTHRDDDFNCFDITYDGSKFVALGDGSNIATSTDGTTWNVIYISNLGFHDWRALAYDGSKFVALGYEGYYSTSTDGTTWTQAVQDSNLGENGWEALAYGNNKFVALGEYGYVSTSVEGTTWTPAVQDTNLGSHNWRALAYNGVEFVALGYEGYYSTSTDGTAWTPAVQDTNLGSNEWVGLTYDGSNFVALGSSGYTSQYLPGNGLVISAVGGTWGSITGTLSNQTDLQAALNNKYDASNPDGFISGITSSDVTTALGYTPYNATNPAGYISSASISSLTDVDLTSVANNQALLYNSTTQKWENKDITITVDSALDSTSTNPVENRVIAQALEGISLAKNPNLNIIGGNLSIDSGNISGFSTTDYMQFPFVFNFNSYHWTLEMGFTTGSAVTTQQNILDSYYGIAFAIRNGKFVLAISSNGSSWDIVNTEGTYSVQANTAYSVKIAWDGTNYTLSYALDETNYTTDITVASALVHHSTQEYVGGEPDLYGDSSQHPFGGTINLNNWKLTVNGLEVWLGMDDVGLGSRANIDLSNLTEAGQYMVDTVKDQNDGSRIKTWTGTQAEFNAITTKDPTTLYNVTDTDPSYSVNTQYKNIGAIVQSAVPLTDAGLHLMDGSLIQMGVYSEFVEYMANLYGDGTNIPSYFCTESEWQTAVTTYGSCGKFVYDSVNNTVRLPKVSGIIEGTTDLTALGDLVEAGLPNITGVLGFANSVDAYLFPNSAFSKGNYSVTNTSFTQNTASNTQFNTFDASLSNPIYGNSTTVQPQAIKVLYYIVIANSTKTEIQVDIDEIATDLNGKADTDLTNINNVGYIKMAGAGMPSSTYINLTVGASGSTYTAPSDGWVILGATTTNGYIVLANLKNSMASVSQHTGGCFVYLPVIKGDVIEIDYGGINSWQYFRFIYAQGSESEDS